MKTLNFKLLPKKVYDGEALIHKFSKISLKLFLLLKNLFRLKNILAKAISMTLIILILMGYYPVWDFPPVKKAVVRAVEGQSQQILSESLPDPVNLPHPGYLSTRFSTWHPAVDIATGLGMPVHPITSGVIEDVVFGLWGLGHFVTISHPVGYKSTYGHMGRIFVTKGQFVTSADLLGEVGLTGHTSGPHTHLEITRNGEYINPLTILPPISDYPASEFFKPVYSKSVVGENSTKILKPDFN